MLMQAFLSQAPTAATPASMAPTQEELNEIAGWGAREKILFLTGYQWLAAMNSPRMNPVGTDFEYHGLLPVGIKAVVDVISAAEPVLTKLPPQILGGQAELSAIAKGGTETSGAIEEASRRWRPVRDNVAQEFIDSGVLFEFEYFGDNPGNPGKLVLRKVTREGVQPDFSAAFSNKTAAEMVAEGISLREKYAEVGVGTVNVFPILGSLSTLVGNTLSFFAGYEQVQEEKDFNNEVVAAIEADETLTPAQKAEGLVKINGANEILENIFQGEFPWTMVIVAGAAAAAAVLILPKLLGGAK